MSCRANYWAITPARSPFTMEASMLCPLQPAADAPSLVDSQDIGRACSLKHHTGRCQTLSSVAVNVSTNNLPTLCCTRRPSCFASPVPLTHSARGSNSAGPCFTSSALRFSLAHSSSCAAARVGVGARSIVGNNLLLSEKMRSIFRRRCTLRTGPQGPMKSRSNLDRLKLSESLPDP